MRVQISNSKIFEWSTEIKIEKLKSGEIHLYQSANMRIGEIVSNMEYWMIKKFQHFTNFWGQIWAFHIEKKKFYKFVNFPNGKILKCCSLSQF